MAVDQSEILDDVVFWLPESNALDTSQLTRILQSYIAIHGDGDDKAPILTYNTLKGAALKNKIMITAGEGQLKDSRVGQVWSSFHKVELTAEWNAFIKNLPEIGPMIGYAAKTIAIGKINPGDVIDILDDEIEEPAGFY